jgi:hypothetical protein
MTVAALLLAVSTAIAARGERAAVILPEEAPVDGPRLVLGAVAEVLAEDEGVAERLRSVSLGYAPPPGGERRLGRAEVVEALGLSGFSPKEFVLQGAATTRLVRLSQVVSEATLKAAIARALQPRFGARLETLPPVRFSEEARVGRGEVEVVAAPPETLTPELPRTMNLLVFVEGLPAKQLVAEIDLPSASGDRSGAPSPAAGPKARLVRRGQQVSLEVEGRGILITTRGRAHSSGALGDEVQVENLISGVMVRGVVQGEARVRVVMGAIEGRRQ